MEYIIWPTELITRLCLPADYGSQILQYWNQKSIFGSAGFKLNNPWSSFGDSDTISRKTYRIAFTLINSGSSVGILTADYSQGPYVSFPPLIMRQTYSNFQLDKTNHKFSYEFYLDNDLEETNSTLLIDDGGTLYWDVAEPSYVTESDDSTEYKKGTDSYKIEIASGRTLDELFGHTFSPYDDWSAQEFICLWFKGNNSNNTFTLNWRSGGATWADGYSFIDNSTLWMRHVIPLRKYVGSSTLSEIDYLNISSSTLTTGTFWFDRMLLDVGQWALIEIFVPDELRTLGLEDGPLARLDFWNGSTWGTGAQLYTHPAAPAERKYSYATGIYFLDGSSASEIYPTGSEADRQGGGVYFSGFRGETKSAGDHSDDLAPDITYSSYFGCKKRIGFAIKMPPEDFQDSSTFGISQAKCRLEIFYDNVVDSSGKQNHGMRYSGAEALTGPLSVDGKFGKALEFDGSDDYVLIPDDPSLRPESEITLEAWIRPNTITGQDRIFDKWSAIGGYALMTNDNEILFRITGSDGTFDLTTTDLNLQFDTWQHIVATLDGSTMRVYKNGVQSTDTLAFSGTIVHSQDLTIGNDNDGGSYGQFKGQIDEVRIYNRALSPTEIKDNMNGGNKVTRNGLVGEWKFEFGNTTYEFENSSNQYYGLQNLNEKWFCLFDPDTLREAYFTKFTDYPTGLEITASEEEYITKVFFKFPSSTSLTKGIKKVGNIFNDSDGDWVPDIFDSDYPYWP